LPTRDLEEGLQVEWVFYEKSLNCGAPLPPVAGLGVEGGGRILRIRDSWGEELPRKTKKPDWRPVRLFQILLGFPN
jgi:hypothetical protein